MAKKLTLSDDHRVKLGTLLRRRYVRASTHGIDLTDGILHDASAWFDTREHDAATRKALDEAIDIFAEEFNRCLIGLWNGAGREGDERPVVILGSAGEFGVVAGSLDHFIALTAACQPWHRLMRGQVGRMVDPALVRALEAAEDTFGQPFRDWIARYEDVPANEECATSWRPGSVSRSPSRQ